MSIGNPIAFAFAATIPIIVALYLLRLKRKRLVVPSTFFWTEMVQDLQANVPFQRLRWNILLLLQVLIAMAVITAMVDPSIRAALNEGQRTIFVIDTSASMSAADGGSTRFERSIGEVRDYCRNLSNREQVMIIEAGEHAQLLLDFTDRLPAIQRTLDSLKTQDTRSDISTAHALALSRALEVDSPRIVVVSDFSGVDPGLFRDSPVPLSFIQAGGAGRNIAITDFAITGVSESESGTSFQAFLTVRNYMDRPVECDVEFYADDELVDVRSISVDSGSRLARVYQSVPYPGGVIKVKLEIEDDLPLDNVAYALPPAGESMEVLIAGDDPFLLLSLAGIPGIRLYQIGMDEYVQGADYDLTFFPSWAPEELPPGNYVFFNPPDREYLPCSMGAQVEAPNVTDWDDGHPMLRFVNPGSFDVFVGRQAEPRPGAMVLIDADSTPLMVYGERNYLRALVFPFDLSSTDLITRPTFPILIYNVVSFFRSHIETGAAGLRTQGIEAVRVEALGEKVRLRGPEGIDLEFPIDAGHAFVDVNRAGVYTMEVEGASGEEPRLLVANFFDEAESDIHSVTPIGEALGGGQITRLEIEAEKRIWKWLSVIALLVLSAEWYFYHRKGF